MQASRIGIGIARLEAMTAPATNVRFRCCAGDSIWHWNSSCDFWPTLVYASEHSLPDEAALCGQCADLSQQQIAA
jgi:hypothetical protein